MPTEYIYYLNLMERKQNGKIKRGKEQQKLKKKKKQGQAIN